MWTNPIWPRQLFIDIHGLVIYCVSPNIWCTFFPKICVFKTQIRSTLKRKVITGLLALCVIHSTQYAETTYYREATTKFWTDEMNVCCWLLVKNKQLNSMSMQKFLKGSSVAGIQKLSNKCFLLCLSVVE
jgi:hypothetical protein